jgi:hypothetical protein
MQETQNVCAIRDLLFSRAIRLICGTWAGRRRWQKQTSAVKAIQTLFEHCVGAHASQGRLAADCAFGARRVLINGRDACKIAIHDSCEIQTLEGTLNLQPYMLFGCSTAVLGSFINSIIH